MCRRWLAVLAVLLMAAAIGAAQGQGVSVAEYVTVPLTELPELQSARPQFARLVATPDYDTALWLILDESRGTDSGYDLLYVDFNYDGRIGQGEVARGAARSIGEVAVVDFPAFAVPAPDGRQQAPGDKPRVEVRWQGFEDKSYFLVTSVVRVADPSAGPGRFWQYALSGQLRVGPSPERTPLTVFGGEPALQVHARPDANDRSAIGIGLTVTLGGSFCDPRSMQGSPDASIVLRNRAGQIVHQASKSLDTFCFG